MTSYTAFHEEITKIAQDREKRPEKPGVITKEKLKRLAIVAPVAAAGGGLGYGTGQLIRKHVLSPKALESLSALSERSPWVARGLKALPIAAGALTTGAGMWQLMKNRRIRDRIEGKHEDGGRTETR